MFVRIGQPLRHLGDDIQHLIDRQQPAIVHNVAQLAPLQELHGNVGHVAALAHIVNSHDIRVVEPSCRLGFLVEAAFIFFFFVQREPEVDRLDRDHAVNQRIPGLVDDAHRPLADFAKHLIAS